MLKGTYTETKWNKDLHDQCYKASKIMANQQKTSYDEYKKAIKWMNGLEYKIVNSAMNVGKNPGGSSPEKSAAKIIKEWSG